jgi:hypothetical protein
MYCLHLKNSQWIDTTVNKLKTQTALWILQLQMKKQKLNYAKGLFCDSHSKNLSYFADVYTLLPVIQQLKLTDWRK